MKINIKATSKWKLNHQVLMKSVLMMILLMTSTLFSSFAVKTDSNNLLLNNLEREVNDVFNPSFDQFVEQRMVLNHIRSLSAGVVVDDQLVWSNNYGEYSDSELVYRIMSMTKSFTATAIMQLAERELLNLTDDVNNYLPYSIRDPKFPNDTVTIENLLSQQSGLARDSVHYYYRMMPDLFRALGVSDYPMLSVREFLDLFFVPGAELNLQNNWNGYKPGHSSDRLQYSNLAFTTAGYIIERVTNLTIDKYMKENVFDPLGLTKTGYLIEDYDRAELATPHELYYDFNPLPPSNNDTLPLYDATPEGAGTMWSTITDLSKYLIAHMNDGIYNGITMLSKDSIDNMHTPRGYYKNVLGYDENYGLGWYHRNYLESKHQLMVQGHEGYFVGYRGALFYSKTADHNIGIVMLTNQGDFYAPSDRLESYFDQIVNSLFDNALSLVDSSFEVSYGDTSSSEDSQNIIIILGGLLVGVMVVVLYFKKFKNK